MSNDAEKPGALRLEDAILGLMWSPDGTQLAIQPASGEYALLRKDGVTVQKSPAHGAGNGQPTWFLGQCATCGWDGRIRLGGAEFFHKGRGLIESVVTSSDGKWLAAAQGRTVHILDAQGADHRSLQGLETPASGVCWNPVRGDEIAVVGNGGARMWRLGEEAPFARFDWGGASHAARWSPDGRWLVTIDQTTSVHLYDFKSDEPLQIEGFETKVRSLAFSADAGRMVLAAGMGLTVWPLTGKTGPKGVKPIELDGFDADVEVVAFSGIEPRFAAADGTGCLMIFIFEGDTLRRRRSRMGTGVTALAWHPQYPLLAVGHEDGLVKVIAFDPVPR